MKTYTYIDRSKYPTLTKVFSCEAGSILQADEKFKATTGLNPEKPTIHCKIEFSKTAGT